LWRAGDLLVVVRDLDTIAVIDPESSYATWTWGRGDLQAPHHATHLSDATILPLDNRAMTGPPEIDRACIFGSSEEQINE
jgi:hypothetical protein